MRAPALQPREMFHARRSAASGRRRVALFPRIAAQPPRPVSTVVLAVLFGIEVLAVTLQRLPRDLSFNAFAFADPGSWIADQFVAAHGARPGVDFGYLYGLLPILIGRGWFGLFGLTPWAFEAAMIVCGLLIALAMTRLAHALRLSAVAIIFLAFALPVGIPPAYFSLAHALEAVLLAHAVAAHAGGKRSAALVLATAACFARPAMGYVYGAMLVVTIVLNVTRTAPTATWRARASALVREITPAALTAIALVAILTFVYGPRSMAATILPIAGMRAYRLMHYGFFGPWGRTFWYVPGASIFAYAATVAPFWLAASIWVIVAGVVAAWQILRNAASAGRTERAGNESARRNEIVACCGGMIAMFIFVMFGGPTSWSIYSYLLVMGVAAASVPGLMRARIASLLTLVAIIGQIGLLVTDQALMTTTAPTSITAGLWSDTTERDEWAKVLALTQGSHATIVSIEGAAALLQPGFAPPINPTLIPGISKQQDFDHTVREVLNAPMVVVPISPAVGGYAMTAWPALARALGQLEVVWRGQLFVVYRHRE
ncbi:MAG: hypothetical protein IVW56_12990 [Candidatus Binataceae bacterium]|nr:hypothetical protein [Candidatus Binataceae bacterium]